VKELHGTPHLHRSRTPRAATSTSSSASASWVSRASAGRSSSRTTPTCSRRCTSPTPSRARSTRSRRRRGLEPGHPRALHGGAAARLAYRSQHPAGRGPPLRRLVAGHPRDRPSADPRERARRLRDELHEGLGRLGYEGPLERQVAAWLAATSLTGDEVIELRAGRSSPDARATPSGGARAAARRGRRLVHRHPRRALQRPLAVHRRLPRLAALQRRQVLAARPVRARPVSRGLPRAPDLLRAVGPPLPAGALARRGRVLPAQQPHQRRLRGRTRGAMHFLGWDDGDTDEALAAARGAGLHGPRPHRDERRLPVVQHRRDDARARRST
jgi:hypothetical protein